MELTESFLSTIKIRQFLKAEKHSESLKFIQKYCSVNDDITRLVKTCMSKLLRSNLKNVDILDIDTGEQVMLANCELRYSFKPGSKTDDLLQSYNVEVTSLNEIDTFAVDKRYPYIVLSVYSSLI